MEPEADVAALAAALVTSVTILLRSHMHLAYIALEAAKVVLLAVLGALLVALIA